MMKSRMTEKRTVSTKEAARLLDMSEDHLRRLRGDPKFPVQPLPKPHKRGRYDRKAIEHYLDALSGLAPDARKDWDNEFLTALRTPSHGHHENPVF